MIQAHWGLPGPRRPHARGLHDRHARSDARARLPPRRPSGAPRSSGLPTPLARPTVGSSTITRASSSTSAPRLPRWRLAGSTSAAGRRAGRRGPASDRSAPFPGSLPGRRRGCCLRRGSASRPRSTRRPSDPAARARVREMYQGWPYFEVLLDLMEMVLAKADPRIASEYDRALVPPDLRPIGDELRARLAQAIERLLRRNRPRRPARGEPRAEALDRRAQPVRRSDQPAAGGAAAPPSSGFGARRPPVDRLRGDGQRHCGGHAEYRVSEPASEVDESLRRGCTIRCSPTAADGPP